MRYLVLEHPLMRLLPQLAAAIVLFALGVLAGGFFLSPEPPDQGGLFADRALARALLEAGPVELAQSDCALFTVPGQPPTVADFLLSYNSTALLSPGEASLHAECGGRGAGRCSVSYSVFLGEKADTNILLFSMTNDGRLVTKNVTCLAQ
jgi:hypothetical protein